MRKDNLFSFIGGAVFMIFAVPLLTEAIAIVETLGECARTKIACIYYNDAKQLRENSEEVEPEQTFAIGFQADPVEYEDEDE